MRDMKRFLNILLTDEEVINLQYSKAGKIVEGSLAKGVLKKTVVDAKPTSLEAQVINAVFDSFNPEDRHVMDQRPDGGNADFSQV